MRNWWWTSMLVVAGLLVLGASAASAAAPPLGHAQSVRAGSGAAAHPPARASRRVFPLRTLNPAALRRAKAAAAARYRRKAGAAAPSRSAPGRNTAVFGGLNQPGLAATDNSAANNGTPPDTTGAIGPSSYIEFVNSLVRIYDRTNLTTVTATADLDTFVGATGNAVFDPQIQYDPVAGHWFYLSDDITSSNHALLAFGWSKTSTPTNTTTDWCKFAVSSDTGGATLGSFFDDYPKLGHDDAHVIFGTNVFGNTLLDTNFHTARIWAYNKPADYSTCTGPALAFAGNPNSVTPLSQSGEEIFTPEPANTADASATGYVAAASAPPAFGGTGNKIFTFKVTGSGPTIAANGPIGLPTSFDVPANVPQPSSVLVLDSLDTRLTQAVAHADPDAGSSPGNEAVWTQHAVDSASGRSVVRWYELLPGLCSGGTCPAGSLRQSGNVSDAANFVFNGAISPAMNGTSAAIDYNTGSSTQLADIRARSRTSSSPLGSMAGELTLGTSSASDGDFTCSPPYGPPCRWGDYAGASPDPNNAAVVWGSNQLNGPLPGDGSPAWVTRNFAITASGNANPTAVLTAAPNPVTTGTPVALSASGSTDSDGTIANYAFDLNGDGTFEINNGSSPTVSTTYATARTVNAGVQVTDNDGGKAIATVAVTVTGPPVIIAKIAKVLSFTATRSRFAVGPRPTAITAKSLPRGTTFKYSLSNLATVRIKVERKTTGARVNGRCVKRTSARRHKPKCTRFVKQGTLTRNNRPAGASRLKFSGRIGSRKLKPGRYRATITAQAAGGPVSVGRSLSFTILKG